MLLVLCALIGLAQDWDFPHLDLPAPTRHIDLGYWRPNELQPNDAKAIWKTIRPGGVHVAVGTERGFIAAGLIPGLEALLLADVDANVVKYNRINALLLKLAKDRADYLKLRGGSLSLWLRRARAQSLDAEATALLKMGHPFFSSALGLDPLMERVREPTAKGYFQNANYLLYPDQFDRVHALAKRGAIHTLHLDLFDAKNVAFVAQRLAQGGHVIRSIDASNAWEYNDSEELKFLRPWKAATEPATTVVLTKRGPKGWAYAGLSWDFLEQHGWRGLQSDHFGNRPVAVPDCRRGLATTIVRKLSGIWR